MSAIGGPLGQHSANFPRSTYNSGGLVWLVQHRPAIGPPGIVARRVAQFQEQNDIYEIQRIVSAVSEHFGCDTTSWSAGHRSDDIARAAAAYLGRRSFGYDATTVAALGYRGPSSVSHAVRRFETGPGTLQRAVRELEANLG